MEVSSTSPIVIDVPVVNSIVIAPDNATSTTTLTATPTSTDPQGNPVTYTYQWYQNNQAISGATSQTLSLGSLTVSANDQFAVGVTPNNGVINGQDSDKRCDDGRDRIADHPEPADCFVGND